MLSTYPNLYRIVYFVFNLTSLDTVQCFLLLCCALSARTLSCPLPTTQRKSNWFNTTNYVHVFQENGFEINRYVQCDIGSCTDVMLFFLCVEIQLYFAASATVTCCLVTVTGLVLVFSDFLFNLPPHFSCFVQKISAGAR